MSPTTSSTTLSRAWTRWTLPPLPPHWRKNLMASTGIEFCKLSFAETHKRSQVLVPELERRLEDIIAQLDVPITINIDRLRAPQNRCPERANRLPGTS